MALTLKNLEAIDEQLKALPDLTSEKRTLTKKEAVSYLRATIEGLRDRGYSLEQIAEVLSKSGMETTAGSLRQYLADRQGGRKRKKTTPQPSPVVASGTPTTTDQKATNTKTSQPASSTGAKPQTPKQTEKSSGFPVREDTKDI